MRDFPRISKIGIELEGGWDTPLPESIMATNWKYDGSVHCIGQWRSGELVSPPYQSYSFFEKFVRSYYPQVVDSSCGMHIHLSAPIPYYERLIHDEFQPRLLDFLRLYVKESVKQGKYYIPGVPKVVDTGFDRLSQRLNNRCTYATTNRPPIDYQLAANRKMDCRYYATNACHTLHGTFEIRILPMFDSAENSLRTIYRMLKFVDRVMRTNIRETGIIADGCISRDVSSPYIVEI